MDKGVATYERIVDGAVRMASRDGLDGLTIGALAAELGLSKSGLFAHFGSKEELQLSILGAALERFQREVLRPAFTEPRGEPRLRAIFDRWLEWSNNPGLPGGCIFVAAAIELDDKPGAARDFLVTAQKTWFKTLGKAAELAVEAGHFRADVDPQQFAFETYAVFLGYHHVRRLLRDRRAESRARRAFDHILDAARR